MIRLGITGGIGSGKTLVCSIFEQMGVPVYNADARAKWLVNHDTELRRQIIEHFGPEAFKDDVYNTAYIGAIVFKDKEKLALLNSLIHPVVFDDWKRFCQTHAQAPLLIKEAAIMLETDSKYTVDKIALVYAPVALRMQRVMSRDAIDGEALKNKMKNQMPEEEKLKLADFVIYNDGEHSLIEQVLKLYSDLVE